MAKKMKHVLLMALSLVLVAALAISGTVAYLTSEDSDVNVMTLGNVKIEQLEYQRVQENNGTYPMETIDGYNSYKLEAFEQNKPLYPAVIPTNGEGWDWEADKWVQFKQVGANGGGMSVFTEPNAVDKFVFVKNTGKSAAYVRTLIAYECGSKSAEEWDNLVGASYHMSWTKSEPIGVITVEDSKYVVLEYVYNGREDNGYHANGVLPAGEVTQCSLGQVYMSSAATNEDVEALDGNKNGTYDILVLSQAVQVEGFGDAQTALDTGFGKTTVETATEWFKGVIESHKPDTWDGTADTTWYNDTDTNFTIDTAEELAGFAKLVNSGNTFAGKTVLLNMSVDMAGHQWTPIGNWNSSVFSGVFDGQNNTISNLTINKTNKSGTERLGLFGYIKNATIQNVVVSGADISADANIARGAVVVMCADGKSNTLSNVTVKDSAVTMKSVGQTYANGVVAWANGGTSMFMNDITVSGLELTASQTSGNEAIVAPVLGYLNQADKTNSTLDTFDVSDVTINVTANFSMVGGVFGEIMKGAVTVSNGKVDNVAMTVNGTSAGVENDIGGLLGCTYKVDHLKVNDVAVTGLDIDFKGSASRVGGISGWEQSVSDYKNVSVSGSITENITTGSGSECGGFVGISYSYPKTYVDCTANVDMTTGGVVGGFVGTSCTNQWASQTDAYTGCIAKGDVAGDVAGGFAGKGWLKNKTTLAMTNVESYGDVTGKAHAGGLIGFACDQYVVIKDSVASRNVVGTASNTTVGGIIGTGWGSFTFENVTHYLEKEVG